jgi:thiosulfate/3-mercaptopyruvate sulfurtransferase
LRVSILDASWYMPNSPRNPADEYLSKRIPGAQYLDLDEVASPHELGLKHMMPKERLFAEACERFGIEPSSHVVIYDSHGVFSSPRALFMFRAFGHENSSILDGGLPAWEAEGLPVDDSPPKEAVRTRYLTPVLDTSTVASYKQIVSNSALNPSQDPNVHVVLDARSRGRYLGTDPEPRLGLSSGHIPNSFSLPFTAFLRNQISSRLGTQYTTFLPPIEIYKALVDAVGTEEAKSITEGHRPVITSCGSGMTAGVLWLGLKLLGGNEVGLYDESWTGYATRESSRIEREQ